MECPGPHPFDQDAPGSSQIHSLANSTSVSHRPSRSARTQPLQVMETCGRVARCKLTKFENFPIRGLAKNT
jgi:hypothetical protein